MDRCRTGLVDQNECYATRLVKVRVIALMFIRQGPSGPVFRTRAGGALGTTVHTRSQYQSQVHQEAQYNEKQA